jgi:hypothetical protein
MKQKIMKADPEEMEPNLDNFGNGSDKVDATIWRPQKQGRPQLSGIMEADNLDAVGSLADRQLDQHMYVRHHRQPKS